MRTQTCSLKCAFVAALSIWLTSAGFYDTFPTWRPRRNSLADSFLQISGNSRFSQRTRILKCIQYFNVYRNNLVKLYQKLHALQSCRGYFLNSPCFKSNGPKCELFRIRRKGIKWRSGSACRTVIVIVIVIVTVPASDVSSSVECWHTFRTGVNLSGPSKFTCHFQQWMLTPFLTSCGLRIVNWLLHTPTCQLFQSIAKTD